MTYISVECTPDDGQRNCPKQVEFLGKNKFGKFVRLLVLLKRKFFIVGVGWSFNYNLRIRDDSGPD
jgi:hypothetical protein